MIIRARVSTFSARAATIPSPPPGTGRSGEQLIRIAGSRADPRSESRHSPSRISTRSHYALWYRCLRPSGSRRAATRFGGRFMQDHANGLPRIYLPRTRVNKDKRKRLPYTLSTQLLPQGVLRQDRSLRGASYCDIELKTGTAAKEEARICRAERTPGRSALYTGLCRASTWRPR